MSFNLKSTKQLTRYLKSIKRLESAVEGKPTLRSTDGAIDKKSIQRLAERYVRYAIALDMSIQLGNQRGEIIRVLESLGLKPYRIDSYQFSLLQFFMRFNVLDEVLLEDPKLIDSIDTQINEILYRCYVRQVVKTARRIYAAEVLEGGE